MTKIKATIVSAALSVGVLFGYVATVTSPTEPATPGTIKRDDREVTELYCPTEDSCTPRWNTYTNTYVIVRVTP